MDFQKLIGKVRTVLSYKLFTTLIFIVLGILMFALLYTNVKPETYDMELFSVAEKTIRSPKTIEDEVKTEEERQKAADEVGRVYVHKTEIAQNRILLLNSIFDFVKEVNQETKDAEKENQKQEKKVPDKLGLLKEKLSADVTENVTETISDQSLLRLLHANEDELERARNLLISHIEAIMSDKIRDEQVTGAKRELAGRLSSSGLPKELELAAVELGKYSIVPNELYDPQLTEERKRQAMEEVEPYKILQGQIIVQEGHLIDREIYRHLELLGLLKNTPSVLPFIGLSIFVFLAVGAIYVPFTKLKLAEDQKQNLLLIISIIFVASILIMKIVSLMEAVDRFEIGYIFPAAMAPFLIRVLVNERFALIMTAILAACGSLVFRDEISGTINMEIAIYFLLSGVAAIIFLPNKGERFNILRAGVLVSIINILIISFLQFVGGGQFAKMEYLFHVIYGVVSGILSAVLAIGVLPFLEAAFGILSTIKLIELSNPNHPLLKKVLTEAPGTYHHSVMVANLAEAACEAIGANGLLARVGAYYHDVGKTKRPHFFIENQINMENPHDRLPPSRSKDIIIAHVPDGVAELKKHKLPKEIVEIAEQHHGTSLLTFFYHKEKKMNEHVAESDYRYPGPKPRSMEAAVISIADSVEAAVRSLRNPTQDEIKKLVHQIVQDRLLDGQLNECNISLKQLETIKATFCETLSGIFHSRIEYPGNKEEKVMLDGTGN
ncbi:HD family phosphohydrolase [Siminovitchia sp. 179-K 8D1 HS]|uniref:HD family phosphohydrolase n=1 Tax=Siminovitchia sp. 179-K 8D1 HS TaxID=3142385 RepID=UPI0039A16C00